jgi:hypothetical protein
VPGSRVPPAEAAGDLRERRTGGAKLERLLNLAGFPLVNLKRPVRTLPVSVTDRRQPREDASLYRVPPRPLKVGPITLPLVAGDRSLDREQHLVIPGGGVEPVSDADQASAGRIEGFPHVGGGAAVLG